jgi:SAM-dependent methyltransferase
MERSAKAESYWDEHAGEHLVDLNHWELNPVVARFQGALASEWGRSQESKFADAFMDKYGGRVRTAAASICCGTGILERWLWDRCENPELTIDGFDVSDGSLNIARQLAVGRSGIRYFKSDANAMSLDTARYDVVFANGALHHVENLEHCLSAVRDGINSAGLLYVNDYVGPSRFQWTTLQESIANVMLHLIPDEHLQRKEVVITDPIALEEMDPSEAVRSGEIVNVIKDYFEIVEMIPRGGTLLAPIFGSGCIKPESLGAPIVQTAIEKICQEEARLIAKGVISSDHVVIVAKPARP